MHFVLRHCADIAGFLGGLILLVSLIGRRSQNPRGLLCCRLACLCLLVGGILGLLHYFQNIDWIHRHHYAFFIYAFALESIGIGMFIVLLILGIFRQEFGPRQKVLKS